MLLLTKNFQFALAGTITDAFKEDVLLFLLVCGMVTFDVITGVTKANILGEVSSSIGTKGLWKKLGILTACLFGMFLQYVIACTATIVDAPIIAKIPIGGAVAAYIIFNEALSICENFHAINPNLLPKWITNKLQVAKETLDNISNEEGK